jgi:hypothetical protein
LLEREVSRKNGEKRVREFLEPWLGKAAQWNKALLGGRILMDGATVYEGDGKLVGAYESKDGAFASWYAVPEAGAAPALKTVFAISGVANRPRPMAVLVLDAYPSDGKDHTFEIQLPMAPGLELVRTLSCYLSPQMLAAMTGNASAGNKFQMRNFRYLQVYPRGSPNLCADTVLRPGAKDAPGWFISRVIEPWAGPIFPAAYRAPQSPGQDAASLALSWRGAALHLKLLFFLEKAAADQEPLVFTVPLTKKELQMTSDWYLKFQELSYGRTVFTLSSPECTMAVGTEDDKSVEDDMVEPEDR